MFRRLGLIPGPDFASGVAAALMDATPEEAERLLEALVDAHLLEVVATPDRYRFHDLLRLYARERAETEDSEGGGDDALRRMLEWYLEGALAVQRLLFPGRGGLSSQQADRRRESLFGRLEDAIAWFEAERGSLVAAVQQAARRSLHSTAWRLADALTTRYSLRSSWADWHEILRVGIAAARVAGNREAEAWLMTNLAQMYSELPQLDMALDLCLQSVAIFQEIQNPRGEARALWKLGQNYLAVGQPHESIHVQQRALAISAAAREPYGQVTSLNHLGMAFRLLGRMDVALDFLQRALLVQQELTSAWGKDFILRNLAEVYCDLHRFDEAIDCCQQSLAISREFGPRWSEGCSLTLLGDTVLHSGGIEAARPCWEEALQIFTEIDATEADEVRARLAGEL
jgi:tetratricopeptide (TPR) repeat protein